MPIAILILGLVTAAFVWIAVRLIRAGARRSPERTLGYAFLTLGVAILPRFTAAQMMSKGAEGTAFDAFNIATHLLLFLSLIGILLFIRQVFHPEGRLGWTLVGVLGGVNVLPMIAMALDGGAQLELTWGAVVGNGVRTMPFIWGFVECVRYAAQLDRQHALGLSPDPIVRNRFRLWTLWTGALGFMPLFVIGIRLYAMRLVAQGLEPAVAMPWALPVAASVMGTSCVVAAIGLWLAFFPPARYAAWVQRKAAEASPASA